jgi:transposase
LPRGLDAQAGTNTVNLGKEVSMGMLAERVDHVIGVDTHRDSHSAAVCNPSGAVTAEVTLAADAFGYKRLLRFAREQASGRRVWAIESTGSFGAGLASFLLEQGEWVVEIDRPARPARRNGAKSDALDAARAAREALSRKHLAQPRRRGSREAIRVLLATREGAVVARTKAIAQLKALIVNAPEQLRHHFRPLTTDQQLARCARLRTSPTQSVEHRATIIAIRSAARRALQLEAEAADLESELELLVRELAPRLLTEPGVGVISAAQLLSAWSHHGRFRSEAAFASLAGAAPIPASSGQVVRHRLNRGGDRQLNRALHTIALSRLAHHTETKCYAARRTAEGKTPREIKRCLKRHLARRLFRLLEAGPTLSRGPDQDNQPPATTARRPAERLPRARSRRPPRETRPNSANSET